MASITNQGVASQAAFGQLGSAYCNTQAGVVIPPTGKVIVAVQFLVDTKLSALVAEDSANTFNTADGSHNLGGGSETASEGSGGLAVPASAVFPKGMTIYGRWTSISQADADNTDGGYIVYFAP